MPLLPYQRREVFLEAIKNRQSAPLDPNNREELFLKAIADNVHGTTPGVPVPLSYDFYEKLMNLPEAHTHTERYYRDILGSVMVAEDYVNTEPYLIRGTADHHAVSGDARLKKLGNTVGVNQLMPDAPEVTNVADDVTLTLKDNHVSLSGTASATNYARMERTVNLISGHKYLIIIDPVGTPASSSSTFQWYTTGTLGSIYELTTGVYTATSSGSARFVLAYYAGTVLDVRMWIPRIIDLTLWYGSNDRIPSDLLSHPENWGRYYAGSLAYNAGTLDSADGTVMTSIGRQMFNKATISANNYVDDSTGNLIPNANFDASDYIAIPCGAPIYHYTGGVNSTYLAYYDNNKNYISGRGSHYSGEQTVPSNAAFVRISIPKGYLDETCVSLYYPGESGYDQYYPFSVLAEVDTGSEGLRGVEGSRDEKLPSGAIKRNRARIDLGTLNYVYSSGAFRCDSFLAMKYPTVNSETPTIICPKYSAASWSSATDKNITAYAWSGTQQLVIIDSAYSDAATFKTAMSGVYLEYPLATPTTEQGSPFSPTYGVEYGGEESWLTSNGIPQGHETTYTIFKT